METTKPIPYAHTFRNFRSTLVAHLNATPKPIPYGHTCRN